MVLWPQFLVGLDERVAQLPHGPVGSGEAEGIDGVQGFGELELEFCGKVQKGSHGESKNNAREQRRRWVFMAF